MYSAQPTMMNSQPSDQPGYVCIPCNRVFLDKVAFDHHRMSHEMQNSNQPVTSVHMANPNVTMPVTIPSTCTAMGIPTSNKDILTMNNPVSRTQPTTNNPVPSTGPFAMGTVESSGGYFNATTAGFSTIAGSMNEQKQLLQAHTCPPIKQEPTVESSISKTAVSSAEKVKEPTKLVRVPGVLKVHACDECERSYKRRDHLNRHKLTHTGIKPYSCEDCGKAFFRKDKLQRHAQVHDKSPPVMYNCVVCGKVFTRKERLARHQKKVHKEVYSEIKTSVTVSQSS